jgi:hypothetical protein
MFRFTIRDVPWLTVVVALGVAWWIDRRDVERRSDAQGRRTYFRVCRSTLSAANLFECWQVLSRKLRGKREIVATRHFLPPRVGGHRLPRYRNSFLRSGLMCADAGVTPGQRRFAHTPKH